MVYNIAHRRPASLRVRVRHDLGDFTRPVRPVNIDVAGRGSESAKRTSRRMPPLCVLLLSSDGPLVGRNTIARRLWPRIVAMSMSVHRRLAHHDLAGAAEPREDGGVRGDDVGRLWADRGALVVVVVVARGVGSEPRADAVPTPAALAEPEEEEDEPGEEEASGCGDAGDDRGLCLVSGSGVCWRVVWACGGGGRKGGAGDSPFERGGFGGVDGEEGMGRGGGGGWRCLRVCHGVKWIGM